MPPQSSRQDSEFIAVDAAVGEFEDLQLIRGEDGVGEMTAVRQRHVEKTPFKVVDGVFHSVGGR